MYTITNVTKTGKALFLATNSRYPYGGMDRRSKDDPRAAPVSTGFEDVAYDFPNPTAPQSDAINADWIERFKREDAAG